MLEKRNVITLYSIVKRASFCAARDMLIVSNSIKGSVLVCAAAMN